VKRGHQRRKRRAAFWSLRASASGSCQEYCGQSWWPPNKFTSLQEQKMSCWAILSISGMSLLKAAWWPVFGKIWEVVEDESAWCTDLPALTTLWRGLANQELSSRSDRGVGLQCTEWPICTGNCREVTTANWHHSTEVKLSRTHDSAVWVSAASALLLVSVVTLRASCDAVYCNRSCLWVCLCLFVCLWVCYHDNSKLCALILTKLSL